MYQRVLHYPWSIRISSLTDMFFSFAIAVTYLISLLGLCWIPNFISQKFLPAQLFPPAEIRAWVEINLVRIGCSFARFSWLSVTSLRSFRRESYSLVFGGALPSNGPFKLWPSSSTNGIFLSVCLFVCLSVAPFWLCSHHRVIMKFSGVITNDQSKVHAKGPGQGHRGHKPT